MYHLPLLPGYGPNLNVRSSAPSSTPATKALLSRLCEAEENGYQGTYFASSPDSPHVDGYMTSGSVDHHRPHESHHESDAEAEAEERHDDRIPEPAPVEHVPEELFAEVVFFAYGVAVFYGFSQAQELSILEDLAGAGIFKRQLKEEDWEIEECHFMVSWIPFDGPFH